MEFGFLFFFLVFGVFWGNFWVFEIFENVFEMRMGDFGVVYLVTFIKILTFCFFVFLVFWVIFEFLKFSKKFWNENGWLWGGLFRIFYSNFDFFHFFIFFVFWGNFYVFETFKNVFGMRMGDFGVVYLVTFFQNLSLSAFWEYFFNFWFLGVLGSFLS